MFLSYFTNSQRKILMSPRKMYSSEKRRKRKQIVRRDGECCCYCRRFLVLNERTIEHVIPRSKPQSSNRLKNLKIACKPCNQSRGNKPFPPPQKHKNPSLNKSTK